MSKLLSIFRSFKQVVGIPNISEPLPAAQKLTNVFLRNSSDSTAPTSGKEPIDEDQLLHATGLERAELESKAKGMDILEEEWYIELSAPFGTVEKPVEVPSIFEERIVGVPDPEDDCLITWGIIKEGNPPMQIVEGGEYFVLKRVPVPEWGKEDH